jgi:TANFOR domain-containing protein
MRYTSTKKLRFRKWIAFVITLFYLLSSGVTVFAQGKYPVTISTFIQPPYSPYFNDYFAPESDKWQSTLIFNDGTEPEWDLRLRLTIESSKLKIQTRPEFIPTYPIRAQPFVPYTIKGADLSQYFQFQNLNIQGISPQQLSSNGRLPEGFYSFCIEILDYKTGIVLSQKACANFWIQINDEPIIITPICGQVLKPNPTQNIQFQWHQSNMVSPNSMGTEYKLKLYEITDPTINPLNAIQNNKVLKIFESDYLNQNSFLYDMTAPALDLGKKYIYTVQAIDVQGKDIFKNGGVSQPCWFYYGYPVEGGITLQQPMDLGGFGLTDPVYFKWSSPSKTINGQYFYYKLRVVKFDSTQTPEEAIVNNPAWYEENTISTNKLNGFDVVINKKLDPQSNFAWQVTAFTDEQQIAQSPVYTFYGPPVIDFFMAGMHEVKVKSTFNRDLNHLNGVGIVKLSNEKTQEVPFFNLKIAKVAGRYVLDYGSLNANLLDTSLIALTPTTDENKTAYFHPTKLKLDKENLQFFGKTTWQFPHPVTTSQTAYVTSTEDWITVSFTDFTLQGHSVLNANNQFTLLEPYGYNLNLYSSSDILIYENKYTMRLYGEFVLPDKIIGTSAFGKNVTIPIYKADQLFYISSDTVTLKNNILPMANSNLVMAPTSFIIDLSEDQSPLKLKDDPYWKGVYFPSFRIDFNTDTDKFRQLIFTKPIPVNYQLALNNNYKSWADGTGLNLFITRYFSSSDKATFNQFPATLTLLTLDIQKNQVQSNSSLTGNIFIPFVSTNEQFSFTSQVTPTGFQPGYLDSLDGTKFIFNKGAGQNEIKFTITRAVFADRERLDMTLDLEWDSLGVSLSNLTGFRAWGNYKIGFVLPNGTMPLATQVNGNLSTYPVTFDGIGAGSSNGLYAFGLTGKTVLGEDVSGHSGAPALNVYSTVPNSFLPKDPYVPTSDSTSNSIPPAVSENSFEDNVAIIKNDMVRGLYDSQSSATASNNVDLSQSFLGDGGSRNVESKELVKDEPAKTDSSWGGIHVSFNQKAFVDQLLNSVAIIISEPATSKIIAAADSQLIKFTRKVDKVRDTLNVKIEREIHKIVDSLCAKIIKKVKKDDFDPSERINSIGDSIAKKLTRDVQFAVTKSVDATVKAPITDFIHNTITGRTNTFIQAQVRVMITDAFGDGINFNRIIGNIASSLPEIIHGIGNDAYGMIQMDKVRNSLYRSGAVCIGDVKVNSINDLLIRAIDAEASYIVSKALSNKASQAVNNLANKVLGTEGKETASAGLGIQMNFQNLGRNLREGRIDKVVKLDAVSIALNTKFVSFAGLIKFANGDPVYGDIWKGDVILTVNMPRKFKLEGIYVNGRLRETPYWFCQISGTDNKDKPGGVMDKKARKLDSPVNLGPVELVAASGRLYHHMTDQTGRPILPDPNTTYGAGVNFVFFDASSHGSAFWLGVGANVEIKEDGNYIIEFEGDVQMVLKNPKPTELDPNACGAGGISMNYNSAESHFLGKGWLLFNKGFCAKGNFMVDVKPGYWAVQIGTRDNMIMVTPGCVGWGAAGWVGVNQTVANLGLGLSYSINESIAIPLGVVKAGIAVNAGVAAGIDATVQYKPSVKLISAGVWVDLWANIAVFYKSALKSGSFNLVNIACSGDLLMTFDPPPTTLDGTVRGRIGILCFDVDFEAGFHKEL